MEKLLSYPGKVGNNIFMYTIDEEQDHLCKTASEYHPEIAAYIRDAKKIPGKTQLLLTALGAGEFWGSNVNGDYFPESDLAHPGGEYGFKTFETMAKVFKHHQNKPTDPNYGAVVLAVYNPTYHRVELIVAVDNVSGRDIVDKMNHGEYPEWSMGCRVKYDVCSVCKNMAKNRSQYCSHLKYYINRIDPESGKHVYAINPKPKFFDISYVLIGADKTAKTHLKVARANMYRPIISSAEIAEKMAADKEAEIKKEIPASPGENADSLTTFKAIEEMKAREKDIPNSVLDSLATSNPLSKVLSTLTMMGIQPKPHEVQRIVIMNRGEKDIADKLQKENVCFDPDEEFETSRSARDLVSRDNFSKTIADALMPFMGERSSYNPHISKRILIMIKEMPEPAEAPRLIKVGGLLGNDDRFNPKQEGKDDYSYTKAMGLMALAAMVHKAMNKKSITEPLAGIDGLVSRHPGLASALGLGAAGMFNQLLAPSNKGEGDKDFKIQPEVPIKDDHLKFAASNLGREGKKALLGLAGARVYSSGLNQAYRTDPEYREGKVKRFMRKHPEAVQAAVLFDSMQGMYGGGTTGLYRKAKSMVTPVLKRFTKMAEAQNAEIEKRASQENGNTTKDLLSTSLVWPLAFGRVGAPVRAIGGLVDYTVSKAGKKLLSKKQDKPKIN